MLTYIFATFFGGFCGLLLLNAESDVYAKPQTSQKSRSHKANRKAAQARAATAATTAPRTAAAATTAPRTAAATTAPRAAAATTAPRTAAPAQSATTAPRTAAATTAPRAAAAAAAAAAAPTPRTATAAAAIKVHVNEAVITNLDIQNRKKLLAFLFEQDESSLCSLQKQITQNLIDEALYEQMASKFKISIPDETIQNVCEDYAARRGITRDKFVALLTELGIYASFVGMVRKYIISSYLVNGVAPKELVRVSASEVNRKVAELTKNEAEVQYFLSEIILCNPEKMTAAQFAAHTKDLHEKLLKASEKMPAYMAFRLFAQQFSQSASAHDGGAIGWRALRQMKKQIAAKVPNLAIGNFSEPILLPNGNWMIVCLNDVKRPNMAPDSDVSCKIAVASIPYQNKMSQSEATRLQRTIATLMDCTSSQELQSFAKDFNLQFSIISRKKIALPSIFQKAKLNSCLQPCLVDGTIDIYMVLSEDHQTQKSEISKEEVEQMLKRKKQVWYSEKLFWLFKKRALISHVDEEA